MKAQEKKGLLALLGIGAGVFAWYKYRNLSPEKKQELQSKVNGVGKKIKDTVNDIENKISQKSNDLKSTTKREIDEVTY